MSWREILNVDPQDFSDFSDKSTQNAHFSPFCTYSHKGQEIEKKDPGDKKSGDIPKINTDNTDIIASLDPLTKTEREYYFSLVEIMQSHKFGKDRQAAEGEAWEIVDEYRSRKKKRLELPSQQRGDGKAIAESFYGKKGNGKMKTSSSTERLHPK